MADEKITGADADAAVAASEKIEMVHEVTGNRAKTTRHQLETLWSRKGWRESAPEDDESPGADEGKVDVKNVGTDTNPKAPPAPEIKE